MPPPLLVDLDSVDMSKVAYDREHIYKQMPHAHEFELLHGVYFIDHEQQVACAYHECKPDGWWVRGHVPGRPIFPGVLQLEAAAQLIAFMTRYASGHSGFVGFGGVEDCRFRQAVVPPCRLNILAKLKENRPRRIKGDVQGVVDGVLAFQATIIGMAMPD